MHYLLISVTFVSKLVFVTSLLVLDILNSISVTFILKIVLVTKSFVPGILFLISVTFVLKSVFWTKLLILGIWFQFYRCLHESHLFNWIISHSFFISIFYCFLYFLNQYFITIYQLMFCARNVHLFAYNSLKLICDTYPFNSIISYKISYFFKINRNYFLTMYINLSASCSTLIKSVVIVFNVSTLIYQLPTIHCLSHIFLQFLIHQNQPLTCMLEFVA